MTASRSSRFEELVASPSAAGLAVAKGDYAELFHAAIGDRVVRRPEIHDVRVRIFGPLEARLQSIDRVVLGGLNEGTWPPETRSDPWLSRPMRRDLGLDPPERRIGLSAHDFAQALGAPEVILVPRRQARRRADGDLAFRAAHRRAGRAKTRWDAVLARGHEYLDLARALDHPAQVKAADRPAPRRRSRRGRRGCRSPPSRTGCAIPTPSTPDTFFACCRSIRSTRRPARATAAPSSMAPSAISPANSPPGCRAIR